MSDSSWFGRSPLSLLAEGVETEEEASLLRLLRCDGMLAGLAGKPVPADEFEAAYLAVGAGHTPASPVHDESG